MDYRNDIQGLRALAVILVFIFHLSANFLPGGFIGVDVFFVISGYLVSSIILNKLENGKFSLLSFYESRLKRIVPAYIFLLLIVSIVASFLFISTDIYSFRKLFFWSLIFNSNNYFATLDTYFGTKSIENPLLHTWTLAVEMQFYLILPLLLLFFKKKRRLNIFLLCSIILLLSYSTYSIFIGKKSLMYFSLLSRMPEFLLGVLAASTNIRAHNFVKKHSFILSLLGFITLLVCAFVYNEQTHFPGLTALIPCMGTLLILVSSNNTVNDFFSNKVLVYLGEISYSVYLWHWPIMAFMRYMNDSPQLGIHEILWAIVLSIILSSISYYLIEKFFRYSKGFKFYLPFGTLSMFTAAMVIVCVEISKINQSENIAYFFPSFGNESHGATFERVGCYGDTTANKTVLLLGDSHANVIKKTFDIIGKRNGIFVKAITNDAYPTIPGLDKDMFREAKYYTQYMDLCDIVHKELKNTDLIILKFSSDGQIYKKSLCNFLKKLNPKQKVLLISDFPKFNKNPAKVNRDFIKRNNRVHNYKASFVRLNDSLLLELANYPNVKYLDLMKSKAFANAPFYNDTLMYYDSAHLNSYGATVYAQVEEKNIVNALHWGLENELGIKLH